MRRKNHSVYWSSKEDDTLRELAKDRSRPWTQITDMLNAKHPERPPRHYPAVRIRATRLQLPHRTYSSPAYGSAHSSSTPIGAAWAAVDFLRKTLDDLRQAGCLEDYNEILNELDSIRLTSPED